MAHEIQLHAINVIFHIGFSKQRIDRVPNFGFRVIPLPLGIFTFPPVVGANTQVGTIDVELTGLGAPYRNAPVDVVSVVEPEAQPSILPQLMAAVAYQGKRIVTLRD